MGNQVGCCPTNVFTIFTGDAKTMSMKLNYAQNGNPVDLSACTAIVANFVNADGTIAQVTMASGAISITSPAILGQFGVFISSAVSALFVVACEQNVDVTFTISGNTFTVRYYGILTVNQVQ